MFHGRVTLELKYTTAKWASLLQNMILRRKSVSVLHLDLEIGFTKRCSHLSCPVTVWADEVKSILFLALRATVSCALSDLYPSHVIPSKRSHKRDITFFQLHLKLANRVISEQETSVPPCARVKIDRTAVHFEADVWLLVVGLECWGTCGESRASFIRPFVVDSLNGRHPCLISRCLIVGINICDSLRWPFSEWWLISFKCEAGDYQGN